MTDHELLVKASKAADDTYEWRGDTLIKWHGISWGVCDPFNRDHSAREFAKDLGIKTVKIEIEAELSYGNEMYFKPNSPYSEITMEGINKQIRYAIVKAAAELSQHKG